MKVGKWNNWTKRYENHEIPDDWNTPLYTDDMSEIVNCASCGRKLPYGDAYDSKEIHSRHGMGYPVCQDCYVGECTRMRLSVVL